ncbi:MAG: hypothetical protein RI580_17640 [Halothece sp. Uz-M2-17]|nr:hypothetical protein [Halothece sp. Uz-M2-17]
MNDLKIAVTRYIGDYPSQEWNRPKVHFVSSTPLAPNRRVRIYNTEFTHVSSHPRM